MEVRGQDKDMGMPAPRRDQQQPQQQTVNINSIFNNPSEAIDHHHHHNHNSLHHHQSNSQQQTHHKPRRDLNQDQDPASSASPSPIAATVSITGTVITGGGSAFRSSQLASTTTTATPTAGAAAATNTISAVGSSVRYRECLKNHAATMGAHVVDGCGEFMPSGEDGTREALKCAACECHRNFHRKETDGDQSHYVSNCYYAPYNNPNKTNHQRRTTAITPTATQVIPTSSLHPQQPPFHQHHRYIHSPSTAPIAPVMMTFAGGGGGSGGGGTAAESSSDDLNMFQSMDGGHGTGQPRKRFRTKFSQEQKDKMMELAEKLEWKIQKQDDQEVQRFCSQTGVKRQVFKVWMHNNKQAMKKKQM